MIRTRLAVVERTRRRSWRWPARRSGDQVFAWLVAMCAAAIVMLAGLILWELWHGAAVARQVFGWGFITSQDWNPVNRAFGAAPFIFGTVVTSAVALLIAAPLGIGTAIFLTDLAPRWLRSPVAFLVEMLAAIPSVIYGLWALVVLVPLLRVDVQPWLRENLGVLPFFTGAAYGVGLLAASLVLAIMILPTITAISRDALAAVPRSQREALLALGATRWEVISRVCLPYARGGIIGAMMLGLGRALGETMAVTMVIGNRGTISSSLFSLGDTMASVIANQFAEADNSLLTSTLIEIGLLLFGVTVLLNLSARLLVWRLTRGTRSEAVL